MDIASYFLFSLVSGVCGVVLWHFPFILPLTFCMYAWYSLIFCIVNYKKKEALSDLEHSTKRNNYFKLVALIVDVSCVVLWKYIEEEVIDSDSFESYLNTLAAKHRIFHIYKTMTCCECKTQKKEGEKFISEKQFQTLYNYHDDKSLPDHKKYSKGKLSLICLCRYSAVQNVNVRVLDITLANYLITRCGKKALGLDMWMKKITEIRNQVFHHSDIQAMSDDKFSRRWQKLEGSIMGIANLISAEFVREINGKIENLKHLVVIPDQVLQHERLCRDYWKSKCAEFELMQMEEMKASAVQLDQLYTGSFDMMCEEVFKKIETLNTVVDKICINVFGSEGVTQVFEPQDTPSTVEDQKIVPVLFQLEVPSSWNTRKIIKAVEQIRLSGNGDSEFKIKTVSSDDLYILAEIVKKVLRKSDKLRIEINQLMTNILTKAKIDTVDVAEVNINMRIPKSKDFIVPTKIKIELKTCFPFKTEYLSGHNSKIAGNKIVLAKRDNGLQIYRLDGTFDRSISIKDEKIVHQLLVIDCNTIAVLYNYFVIGFFDLSTGLMINIIDPGCIVFDIAHLDGLLYAVVGGKQLSFDSNREHKIIVMKLSGELIRHFFVPSWRSMCHRSLAIDSNGLFICSVGDHAVYCYDLQGILRWKFQSDKTCNPSIIAAYEDGKFFAADEVNFNILLVSADGKSVDVVLTFEPSNQILQGIYYDKTLKLLMVYDTDNVYLYQVRNV